MKFQPMFIQISTKWILYIPGALTLNNSLVSITLPHKFYLPWPHWTPFTVSSLLNFVRPLGSICVHLCDLQPGNCLQLVSLDNQRVHFFSCPSLRDLSPLLSAFQFLKTAVSCILFGLIVVFLLLLVFVVLCFFFYSGREISMAVNSSCVEIETLSRNFIST